MRQLYLSFLLILSILHVFSQQPTVLNTNTGGSFTEYSLSDRGQVRASSAIQADITTTKQFLFANATGNYDPKWSGSNSDYTRSVNQYLAGQAFIAYQNNQSWTRNMEFAAQSGYYYTFIVGKATNSNNDISVLETSYNPANFTAGLAQTPASTAVFPGQTVNVTITLSGNPASTEKVYVRYSTSAAFTTSNLVEATSFNNGIGAAAIPGSFNTPGATVYYYAFTSNQALSATNPSNVDFLTLNFRNASGQNVNGTNYSYTVANGWTTNADGNWNDPPTWTANAVPSTTESMGAINIGHNVTLTQSASGSTLNIASGKTLSMTTNTLALTGAATIDGSLNVSGNLADQFKAATLTITGTGSVTNTSTAGSGQPINVSGLFSIADGGTYTHSTTRSAQIGNTYNYSNNSNVIYTNYTSFPTTRVYGNLRCIGGTNTVDAVGPWRVNGNLRISGTTFNQQSNKSGTLEIGGSLIIDQNGTYIASNNAGVTGTLTFVNAGIASGNIQIESGSSATLQNVNINSGRTVGLLSNIIVASGGTITIAGTLNTSIYVLKGSGNLSLASTGILGIGSPDGISSSGSSTGNIQLSGTRNYDGGTLAYNGTANQITGTGCPSSIGTLLIANTGANANNTITLSADLTVTNLTLTSGYLDLKGNKLDLSTGAILNATGGDFASGSSGTVTFKGSGSVTGTVNFYPAVVQSPSTTLGVTYNSNATIRTSLQLNANSFISSGPPVYANGSTLYYNTGGTFTIGNEWLTGSSGAGVPYHVQLGNGASGSGLSFDGNTATRQCNGNFTISDGCTLTLSTASGGDLKIGGNWMNQNTVAGNGFVHNNRALRFIGSTDQSLQNASSTLTIGYLLNEKPSGNLVLNNNLVLNGTTTNGTAQVLQLLGSGGFDLNGNTITINGDQARSILVNANGRQITSSAAGGIINFASGTAIASVDVSGTGTLDIGSKVTVQLLKGIDVGSNRTTINGTLELFTNSFCQTNSPVYGPNGKLKYSTGIYNTSNEWIAGTTVGTGVPYAVELNLSPVTDSVTITGSRTVPGALTLTSGKLFLNGQILTVNGTISGTGSFTGSSTSGLVLGGPGSTLNFTQTSSATKTLKNLMVNAGASATLGNALDITAGSISGSVTVNSGASLASNGNLTLKSDASGTAYVAQSAGSITGAVTVERYIPATGGTSSTRRWRLVTAPVSGTSINASWQEGMTTANGGTSHVLTGTATTATPQSGYGTLITGQQQRNASTANGNGFDFWDALYNSSASVRRFKPASGNTAAVWTAISTTKATTAFDTAQAYLLFVRGDRFISSGTTIGATTLRASGTLRQGDFSIDVPAAQPHTLIGNPYASPLDFKRVYDANSTKIKESFILWQASFGTNTGGYQTFVTDNHTDYYVVPNSGSATPANRILHSGEGFFVMPKSGATGSNTITIQEAHKSTGTPGISVFRTQGNQASPAKLYVNLNEPVTADSADLLDGVLARYDAVYTADDDIPKAFNLGENLSIQNGDSDLIVISRPLPKASDTMPLRIWNLKGAANYQLETMAENFAASGLNAVLEDKFLNTQTPVDMTQDARTKYNFSTTANAASLAQDRFRILFTGGVLPLHLTSLKAYEKAGGVSIEWKVENESGIKTYELEKSTNGQSFQKLATLSARSSAGTQVYESFDGQPAPVNYYRVKLVGITGEVKYSPIAKVVLQGSRPAIAVYPNPASGGILQLQLQNKPAGTYTITLYNSAGQRMAQQTIGHPGGSATEMIRLDASLPAGIYHLEVKDEQGGKEQIRVSLMK
jgi:hypothetical protein